MLEATFGFEDRNDSQLNEEGYSCNMLKVDLVISYGTIFLVID
jgi:hypothetical protein